MEKQEVPIENSLKKSEIKESLCLPGVKEETEEVKKTEKKSGLNEITLILIILGFVFVILVLIIFFVMAEKKTNEDVRRKRSLRSRRLISDRGIKVNSNINEKVLKNLQRSGIIKNQNDYEDMHIFGGVILKKKIKQIKIKKIKI